VGLKGKPNHKACVFKESKPIRRKVLVYIEVILFQHFGRVSADRPADHKECFNVTEPFNDQRVSFTYRSLHLIFELQG